MGMGKGSCVGGSLYRSFTKYPRCQIFSCPHSRGVSYRCCAWCPKYAQCADKCLNHPDLCGQCIIPEDFNNEMSFQLDDINLPDPPDIRHAEQTGLKPGEVPFDEPEIECPICGRLCETFYFDCDGTLFGCDQCVTKKPAEEYDPDQ